jgi:hypothetical protein
LEGGGDQFAKARAVLGPKITVDVIEFMRIVEKMDRPVVVIHNPGGLGFSRNWEYLASYKGFLFHTVSRKQLAFMNCELYETKKMD